MNRKTAVLAVLRKRQCIEPDKISGNELAGRYPIQVRIQTVETESPTGYCHLWIDRIR